MATTRLRQAPHSSQILSGSLRKVDELGRLGGDEFGVILPRTNRVQVEKVAASLLRILAAARSGHGELSDSVTASIGIVIFPIDSTDPDILLSMADAAMDRVKAMSDMVTELGIKCIAQCVENEAVIPILLE